MTDEELANERAIKRAIIREALAQTDSGIGEAVVTNWLTIVERMDSDGDKWLTQFSGDAADQCPPDWLRRGMLHQGLRMLDAPDEEDDGDE